MSISYYVLLVIALVSLFNGIYLSRYEKKYINLHKDDLMDEEII